MCLKKPTAASTDSLNRLSQKTLILLTLGWGTVQSTIASWLAN